MTVISLFLIASSKGNSDSSKHTWAMTTYRQRRIVSEGLFQGMLVRPLKHS